MSEASYQEWILGATGKKAIWMGQQTLDSQRVFYPDSDLTTEMFSRSQDHSPIEPPSREELLSAFQKGKSRLFSRNYSTIPYVGCDPEIFFEDVGKVVPAWEFLPPKKAPRVEGQYYQYFWDGVQAEFGSVGGRSCLDGLARNIFWALRELSEVGQRYRPNMKFNFRPVIEVPKEILQTASEEQIQLGCDPSQQLYENPGEPVPDGRKLPVRFAGGHIHFGLGHSPKCKMDMVWALDAVLGVWSVGATASQQKDEALRRRYYGRAGEYRLPSHGLEYRTLSNFWLRSPKLYHCVFDIARGCTLLGANKLIKLWDATPREVMDVINFCDVEGARKILARNEEMFLGFASALGSNWTANSAERALRVGMEGFEVEVPQADILTNWGKSQEILGSPYPERWNPSPHRA